MVINCRNIILFVVLATCTATPILLLTSESPLAHPAVIINSAMEDNLPNQLRNNFYKNPSIAAGLAKESWFIDKEMQCIYTAYTLKDMIYLMYIRR
ncbi:hypothetical protein PUN28_009776 [Cardiocondyla obscurior]|uniref:Uncharacterized protein n=1 Tax=Cardiocondyla obscurior TaxID=286306 RepID=A0AAW2FR85_9HYME